MLSIRHLLFVPDRLFVASLTRHLSYYPAQPGSESKYHERNYPSVSSYYKVNNQSAIDIAAAKVRAFPDYNHMLQVLNMFELFMLAIGAIDTLHDPVLGKKS